MRHETAQRTVIIKFPIFDVAAFQAAGDNLAALVGPGKDPYTGPFQVTSLDRTKLVAERYDRFWGGKVALDGVQVLFISDPQARDNGRGGRVQRSCGLSGSRRTSRGDTLST